MKKEEPVTCVVYSYNSSATILETLESIKAQNYQSIKLIVSDDCSTDDTVDVCRGWIENNKDRFISSRLLTVKENTGISGNANRGWDACETEWIKSIAGDDLLLPDCIKDNMEYVENHPDAIFVFSRAKTFGSTATHRKKHENKVFDYSFFYMTPEEQYERIKYGSCLPAATGFYNVKEIRKIGIRHDERIPLLEDRPMWINVIRKGIKFHFFDKDTVLYRLSNKSLSTTSLLSPRFYESTRLAFFYYVFQEMYERDPEAAIREAVGQELKQYQRFVKIKKQRDKYLKCSPYIFAAIFRRISKTFGRHSYRQ